MKNSRFYKRRTYKKSTKLKSLRVNLVINFLNSYILYNRDIKKG